jgi:hypothetical protein
MDQPFHIGERALQLKAGVRDRLEQIGQLALRDHMPDQHRELFGKLPFLILGALDDNNRPWATMLVGEPGFVATPDAQTMRINALPGLGDPLAGTLAAGSPVGLLGIQLETRRRNRMNGMIEAVDAAGFTVHVGQSFGNCPQYIQAREPRRVADSEPVPQRETALLSPAATAMIEAADTFFIATAAPDARLGKPAEGVDVSHRGGKPGFVRVTVEAGRTVLTAPDFNGNSFFNTFGNLVLNPKAGLLFVDFSTGGVLAVTGEAEVIWDGPELKAFTGAERLLRLSVTGGISIAGALPLRWSPPEAARQLAATGSWDEVARAR